MPNDEHDQTGDTVQDNASPKYATLEEVTTAVSEMINKAITSRSKATDKAAETKMSAFLEAFEKKMEERFSSLSNPSQSSSNESKFEDHPMYKGMQKKFQEMQERLDRSEKEKAEERDKARDVSLRQRVTEELSKAGIDSSRTRHALALLVDAEKRVSYDDDGELLFRDLDNQEYDLSTGLRSWSKSEDAKVYLPARGVTGSGDRKSASRQTSNGKGISEEDASFALFDLVKQFQ